MKIKKKGLSVLYTIICSALALVMAMSLIGMFISSYVKISYGDTEYSEVILQSERSENPFEDSDLFARILTDNLSSVIRKSVISKQMEDEGAYNPKKIIDISAFANRYSNGADNTLTAGYYLDDLIKWGNYGFDYKEITGTPAQLDTYFYAMKIGDERYKLVQGEAVHDELENSSFDEDFEETAQDYQTMYVLVDRYKSAEGYSLLEYAGDRYQYETLVKNLRTTSRELFMNYSEYEAKDAEFLVENSNLRYCIQLGTAGGKMTRYSNLSENVIGLSNDEISAVFTSMGKYICFNPDKLQLVSNIDNIYADELKDIVRQYSYAFPDNSRVWIAVDTSYPVKDIYSIGKIEYSKNSDLFVPSLIAIIISIILYLFVVVFMTMQAGKVVEITGDGEKKNFVRPSKIDNIPIEVWAIVTSVVVILLGTMVGMTFHSFSELNDVLIVITCFEAVLINVLLIPMYLILVRKIKCHLVWKGSFIRWLCIQIRNAVVKIYDNGMLITRTWIPFMIFLVANLILVLLGLKTTIIAFLLDIIVGCWLYSESKTREDIVEGIRLIAGGNFEHKIETAKMHGDNLTLATSVNSIGDGIREAVETSMKDEKMKADLITNVSHDIKTPLTSIINYVDLIKRENISNERVVEYIGVLDTKSQRLKQLIDDLVEASKISSGNFSFNIGMINFVELIHQAMGEFDEKFEEKSLQFLLNFPSEPVYILADSRGLYRVIENLFINIYKYALSGTRVYLDMVLEDGKAVLSMRNISSEALGISASELTERFIRGDKSRGTEGSGLGLSIAKSLTEALGGTFEIVLDGDLFKSIIAFKTTDKDMSDIS